MAHYQRHRGASTATSSIMYRFAVLLFIVASAFPLTCSSAVVAPAAASDSSDIIVNRELHSGHTNNHNRHHHQHRRRQLHAAAAPGGPSPSSEQATAELAPQVFSGYTDSYITKKAAQELQEKLKQLNRPPTDEEYNALLQKLVTKPKSDPSYTIYNKKYYDYLPSESGEQERQEEVLGDKVEQSVGLDESPKGKRKRPHKKAHHPYLLAQGDLIDLEPEQQPQGERRAKRSVDGAEEGGHEIRRRQAGVWSNQFQRFDQRRTFPAASSDYAVQPYTSANWAAAPAYQPATYISGYNVPWTTSNRVYNTHVVPNNYYLPVAPPPQFIVRPAPQQPWMRFPIPGVVYNPAFPPMNPPGTMVPRPVRPLVNRPDTNSIPHGNDLDGNLDTRFGETDDDDDRFIFDVEDRTQAPLRPALRPFTQAPPQSPRFPTRRPAPPLIHNSDNVESTNGNTFGGDTRPVFSRPSVNTPQQRPPPVQPQLRPATRRPPPSLIHNSDDDETGQSTNQLGSASAAQPQRPQFSTATPRATPTTTTRRPAVQQDTEPSRCVWAIVNCCLPNTNSQVRHSCFERFGCAGAFWDINPCNENVFDSAVDVADKYFE